MARTFIIANRTNIGVNQTANNINYFLNLN